MAPQSRHELLHASAVALGPAGLLITGKSGTGKSSLALELVSRGAELVADDQVHLTRKEDGLLMTAPDPIAGRIEARGIGILTCPTRPAWARWVVDLDDVETERLPERQETVIAGVPLPRLHRVESAAFPAMLYTLLQGDLA